MLEDRATQWLAFSNADQRILCEETRGILWDSLLVPGTLATYYKQGVGGYVLARRKPFVIDPRTPLIQTTPSPRPDPRASHKTLAAIHHPEIGTIWEEGAEVNVEMWTEGKWREAVVSVLDFQTSFEVEAAQKIDKYEAILREAGLSLDIPIHGPERLIPPYWAASRVRDQWWTLSRRAIEIAMERHAPDALMPVLCLRTGAAPDNFTELIASLPEELDRIFCWRGRWDEARASVEEIHGWLRAVDYAAERGVDIINMYGGALSVLMTGKGLAGVNHGLGYSESRSEVRLGQTGAPPMRYYVPRLKQFLPVPQAQFALERLSRDSDDWHCDCRVCGGRPSIVDMTTDDLKTHFLLCRAREYEEARDLTGALDRLDADAEYLLGFGFRDDGKEDPLSIRGRAFRRWIRGLRTFA